MQSWILPYLKKGSCVLEIGCGFGFNLDFMNQNNKNLHLKLEGLEISREASENVEKAFGIPCYNSTIEEFKPEKKYDAIIMSHVLEHFEDPSGVLDKVWSLLNDGCILWVEVPNILYPNPTKSLNNWLAKEHISYFSPDKLKYLLILNGFKIINQKHLHFVGFLAQKEQKGWAKAEFTGEYDSVKTALRKQKFKNKLIRLKSRFGIKTTKYKA